MTPCLKEWPESCRRRSTSNRKVQSQSEGGTAASLRKVWPYRAPGQICANRYACRVRAAGLRQADPRSTDKPRRFTPFDGSSINSERATNLKPTLEPLLLYRPPYQLLFAKNGPDDLVLFTLEKIQ